MKRLIALLLCIALFSGIVFSASAALPDEAALTDEEWSVLLLTNRERLKQKVDPLTATPFLQDVGDVRADEITVSFSHTRPDGTDCYTALDTKKYPYRWMGENIAFGQRSPAEVMNSWMNSEGHRENILSDNFRHIGVGHKAALDSAGYRSNFWVQFFYSNWSCSYSSVKLAGSNTVPGDCASIDEARLTLALECSDCGTCYLPLMQEFCTGFDPDKAGTQTITVSCLGLTTQFDVVVGEKGSDDNDPSDDGKDPEDSNTSTGFSDVAPSAWYAEAVRFAVVRGLMNGVGNEEFDPEGSMTRAMLVTVLWRDAGSPAAGVNRFTDVPNGQWYTPAVTWARDAGVVNGTSETTFDPDGSITREQMAAILYRYANNNSYDTTKRSILTGFPDAGQVSAYAQEPLEWAVAMGLINGSDGYLLPQGNATRAQVSAILMRYLKNVAIDG